MPPLLPLERRPDELLERHALQQMLERPAVRGVADQDDRLPVVAFAQVGEERPRLLHDIAIALSAREGDLDALPPLGVDLRDGTTVQLAVVALAEPRVESNRDRGVTERNLGRLDGASEV